MSSADTSVGQSDIGRQQGGESQHRETYFGGDKSWRELLEVSSNRSRKIRGSNYVQLATVENNEPRCRCVVFRGFQALPSDHPLSSELEGKSCILKMITDARSEKVKQAVDFTQNNAEMVWWFPKSSEQYRVRGGLLFVGGGTFPMDGDKALVDARKQMWGNLSDSARESFFVEPTPGRGFEEPNVIPVGGRDVEGKVLDPPDHFLLMLLIPRHIDYLRLQNMYRQVDVLATDGSWSIQRVNP